MGPTDALPTLETGVTSLHSPSATGALRRLVVDELRRRDGPAYWVDTGAQASTYALYDLAPSERALSSLRVARAFTAYQHRELVDRVARRADPATSLVVVSDATRLYADPDVPGGDGAAMLEAALARLADVATAHDAAVLLGVAPDADERLAGRVRDCADRELACERTPHGLRFEGADYETLVYREADYWQTTIPYWVELLGAVSERPAVGIDAPPSRTDAVLAGVR
jgi:hypothetical protein